MSDVNKYVLRRGLAVLQQRQCVHQAIDQWVEQRYGFYLHGAHSGFMLARKVKPIMNEIEHVGGLEKTEIRTLELEKFLSRVEDKYGLNYDSRQHQCRAFLQLRGLLITH